MLQQRRYAMIGNTRWVVCTAWLILASAGQAQEAITIKVKERGAGDSVHVERGQTTTTKLTVRDAGGALLADKKEVKGELHEFTETVQARETGKPPTKVERVYAKSQSTNDGNVVQ